MTVAATARALVTLTDYKLYKDPSTAPASQSTSNDDFFQTLINAVGDLFYQYCRLPLIYEQYAAELHDGTGKTTSLWLRNFPAVTTGQTFTITEDSGYGAETLTLNTDFKLRATNGELIRISGLDRYYWANGIMNISAAYTAGRWANTAAVPPDMKALACQAVDWLNTMGPATYGARLTDVGVIRPDNMPKPIKLGLAPYVRGPGV